MEMQQVRYFVALAELRNFTRAAQTCNVTQPAFSRAIQQLEHELGGPLINRERGNLHLTELGRMMLPYLAQIAEQAQSARDLLLASPGKSIRALASEHRRCRTRFTKLLSVAGLAPDIIVAILQGRQPKTLNSDRLMDQFVPSCWTEQRMQLGFA